MPRIAYLGPEGTFTEAALLQMAAGGLVPGAPSARRHHAGPDRQHARRAGRGPLRRRRLRLRADRELDRRFGAADAGQPGHRHAAADLRRADPRRGVHASSCGPARRRGRRRPSPRSRSPPPRCGSWLAAHLPTAQARPGQLERRGRPGRRRRPRRRRRSAPRWPPHRYGLDGAGRRRRRRAQRAHPVRAGRPAGTAAGAHRRRPHVGGAAPGQRPRRAGVGA